MKHLEEVIQDAIVHGQERYRRPYKKILIGKDEYQTQNVVVPQSSSNVVDL